MPVLGSADLQNIATERLASQNDQQTGSSVLPPFSGNLSVDEKLQLSRENFNQLIEEFYRDKDKSPLSQLRTTPPFPTPHVLAQFASKAYTDYKKQETDAQYETRLVLQDGWKLLTTASNITKTNGYFGAAYWHPEHQQIVVAHRGTNPTSLGALWTDVAGVVFKHHVSQMGSASTFAHKVVEVLREVSRMKRVSFQLFFTGHSLGGWLAQVTTFTTKYLKREGKCFQRSINDNDCYHPHTVVFDSPGCQDMLSQMRSTFDVRGDERTIDIELLDITSYLSAPNRINTCNEHLGTVYRIFPDLSDTGSVTGLRGTVYRFFSYLSDMVWQIKRFALYTLAAHSMDKIVAAFDPETGQVHKNEQGQLKVQKVIDWPISTGLRGGEEYERFFEWAKELNNYHPDIKNVSSGDLNYCPFRYQTALYEEGVNSLSTFSQKEQEFLQCYHKLREWPEFRKLKELFSALDNNQAQEEAVKKLQDFVIEINKIRCTDAIALQALIPYVKQLLQLFPEIKEIKHTVLQCENRPCVQRIRQSPLEFNSDAFSIREFLESKQQKVLHLQMTEGNEWTGLIKIYQLLQKTNCLTEGQYTVLNLERLLTLSDLIDFSTLRLPNEATYLMLVVCEVTEQLKEERKNMIRKFFETTNQKPYIKIILTTGSEDKAAPFLKHTGREIFGNGFYSRYEQLIWSDLISTSQKKLLEKSVKFQGHKISLNELISAESAVANFLPLGDLLQEKEVEIVNPVPISNAYNETYYIGRTLHHQKTIKQDIFNDKDVKDKHVFLAITEQQFKQLCQLYPNNSVHWLEKDKGGKLVWRQSQGSLATLRKYIDTESSQKYTGGDLDKLLKQAQHNSVMLISDTAGMGKSTLLTHLSMQIKMKFPAKWVVRIDLNDHTYALNALKNEQIHKEKAIEFVSEKLLELKPDLETELFKQCCEQKQKVRIVIMLDGFDEISPSYKETVIDLLQALRQTAVEQLWVTTRPHLREELENKLQQLSYTLEPFSEEDQVAFLTKFWSLEGWFTEMDKKEKEECKQKLQIYAEELIKKLTISISDKETDFTGIPLQTRMLAEAFDKKVRVFCQSSESMPELKFNVELPDLYRRFIKRKYDIYQEEKLHVPVSSAIAKEQRERELRQTGKDHQLLALKVLLTEEQAALIESKCVCTFSVEELTRFGIVQVSNDGKPHFIHLTFAEYFVADYLVNRLTEGNNTSEQVLSFILQDIFQKEQHQVIRAFIDGFLSRSKLPLVVLKDSGNRIDDLTKYNKILHIAALEGNANIIRFFLDSVQAGDHRDTINEMMLEEDKEGLTVWHIAVLSNNKQVLEELWECAEKNLTAEGSKHKSLLARVTVKYGSPAPKAWYGSQDPLRSWRNKVRRLQYRTEHTNQSYGAGTVLHVAAELGNLEVLQKLLDWTKEKLTTDEIKEILLVDTNQKGQNVWHLASIGGNLETLLKLWECAIEKLTTQETNKLLLATDHKGRTLLHAAVKSNNLVIINKVWEWANEKLTREEIKNKILLGTDSKGMAVWQFAARRGNSDTLQILWEWANELLTREEIQNNLLLSTDNEGRTAWHWATRRDNSDTLQKLRECANELLARDVIENKLFLNKLLLSTDQEGMSVWHWAACAGASDTLQNIWEWANQLLTREEIKNKLLLSTDNEGKAAWHWAARQDNSDILKKLREWANELLAREEIKNKLLLSTDQEGMSAWQWAAWFGASDTLQTIWEWAKELLTREEIKNKLFLSTDNEGETVWDLAEKYGNTDLLKKLWEWANEFLTREEIKNDMFLRTDKAGKTVWSGVVKLENSDI